MLLTQLVPVRDLARLNEDQLNILASAVAVELVRNTDFHSSLKEVVSAVHGGPAGKRGK